MAYWAFIFLLVALTAGFLGFSGLATIISVLGQVLFFVFITLFFLSLIRGLTTQT